MIRGILKLIIRILMIVIFPIGMLYCIVRALLPGRKGLTSYLGMIFIFVAGFALCFCFLRQGLLLAVVDWIKSIGGV